MHDRANWPPRRLVVLTGLTGAGKSAFLRRLAMGGERILDLEQLASHRGSAFGATGRQPTHRTFCTALAEAWRACDPSTPVWIEDKPAYLGSVGLPVTLQGRMAVAPVVELIASPEQRCARIFAEYAGAGSANPLAGLDRMAPRLGIARAKAVRCALMENRIEHALGLLLEYYDEAYELRARQLGRVTIGQASADDDSYKWACIARSWFKRQPIDG